jgi:hypothetical protein
VEALLPRPGRVELLDISDSVLQRESHSAGTRGPERSDSSRPARFP